MTTQTPDIFQALIAKHDIQRKLCDTIEKYLTSEKIDKARAAYPDLALELKAHAAAEERHLYLPVMQYDEGLDLSRHAIAEHHEMDEMMETLEDGRIGDEKWQATCQALVKEVRHHLQEEENKFFKDAKKLLDTEQQIRLGALYNTEHEQFEAKHAD